MSILTELPKIVRRKAKRVGRGIGSGKGSKSTRGTTRHQKARSDIPLHFEGGQARLVKKYPLLRGKGKNKSSKPIATIVNLVRLNTYKDGEIVDLESLKKKHLIGESVRAIKILAKGNLERKLTVKISVSTSAKKAIEKAGGTIIEA